MDPRPSTRAPWSFARWAAPLAAACLLGCGSGSTDVVPAAESPPTNAKERAATNPRIKADTEGLAKKAKEAR